MKIGGLILSLILVTTLNACTGDTSTTSTGNSAVPDNYFDEVATLQGTVFDAISGDRITDATLKITLVRGTTYQAAQVITGTQEFAGDYALTSIPLSINNQTQYRIAATLDGYQTFEAAVAFDAATSSTLDKNYNFLGNIYLFPLGTSANDLKINVRFENEPVTGATVLLQPMTANNTITTDSSNIFQAAQNGFQGSLNATTDTTGAVTFAGANLVLGGQYRINVLPLKHEDIQLSQGGGTTINIGASSIVQNINMSDVVPGFSEGLYIVSASNADTSNITGSGALTLVFSRPVSFVDEPAVTATLNNATTAVIDSTSSPDSTVTGTLSADGLTMTLTPAFATAPIAFDGSNAGTADNGLTVSFSSLEVRLQSANDTAQIYDVFTTLVDETGTNPSPVVQVTQNF